MISAPSPPLPLNGNKSLGIRLIPLVLLLFFSSCDLFKKAQTTPVNPQDADQDFIEGRRVYDPELGQYVVIKDFPTEELEVIQWTDVAKEISPPITSYGSSEMARLLRTGTMGSEFFNRYNVALILPFLAQDFDPVSRQINPNSEWALHFYGGARMAIEELERQNIKFNVSVYDSRGDVSAVNRLLFSEKDLRESHLIVGPYRRDNVKQVAEFAKTNDIAFVSPYSGTANLSEENPNYIQVSPTLETHCRSLVRRAKERFRDENIVLLVQDNPAERAWLRFCQEEHFLIEGSDRVPRLKEYVIPATSGDYPAMNFDSLFARTDSMALIVPSWSEPFVYNVLRKADLAKTAEFRLEIYGLPQWMSFDQMDFDYYEELNVFVSSNLYLNHNNPGVRNFKERYIQKYGIAPQMESFLGYDVMLYFGQMLNKHGTKFQYSLELEKKPVLHTRFEFMPRYDPQPELRSQEIEQFENKFVHILQFRNYLFQPTR